MGEFFAELWKQAQGPFIWGVTILILLLLLSPVFAYLTFAKSIANKEQLVARINTGLVLLDRNGKEFFSFSKQKEVTYIPISQISLPVQQAVIAAEDKDFYKNPGFSINGLLRAFLVDIFTGTPSQGGSTITQQLVKNVLLTPQKSFVRKFQEIVMAFMLSRQYSKQDILEMYLNSSYFGEGAYGIENASERYFGIHASELDLAQAALLTGLLPAPSALSPISNGMEGAKKHQQQVLDDMVQEHDISSEEENGALAEELTFNSQPQENTASILAPHFALMVKDELIKRYGEQRIVADGFIVKTTLNSDWQKYAESVVKNQVASLRGSGVSNGAAVVMDPTNGEIETLVGSHSWDDEVNGKVNMAITPRQPGSSFKPIIYSMAFDDRLITPATILQDIPTTFPGNYRPKDYDGKYRGSVTVRRALANSLNIPAVSVMETVGVTDGVEKAKDFGITTLTTSSDYGLSLILGAAEVKLLDLTDAYATFANNGARPVPMTILEIRDKNNNIIYSGTPQTQSVISEASAFLISSILSDNTARQEEFGNLLTISQIAAVKTGTTEDYRDSLTMGYTPSLVVGVWVGNNNNMPMNQIAGSLGAAPIWKQLMEKFLPDTSNQPFSPSSVTEEKVCIPGSAGGTKGSVYTEYFLSGTEPPSCSTAQPLTQPTISYPTFPVENNQPTIIQPTIIEPTFIFPSPTIFEPSPTPEDVTPTEEVTPPDF